MLQEFVKKIYFAMGSLNWVFLVRGSRLGVVLKTGDNSLLRMCFEMNTKRTNFFYFYCDKGVVTNGGLCKADGFSQPIPGLFEARTVHLCRCVLRVTDTPRLGSHRSILFGYTVVSK